MVIIFRCLWTSLKTFPPQILSMFWKKNKKTSILRCITKFEYLTISVIIFTFVNSYIKESTRKNFSSWNNINQLVICLFLEKLNFFVLLWNQSLKVIIKYMFLKMFANKHRSPEILTMKMKIITEIVYSSLELWLHALRSLLDQYFKQLHII